MSYFALLALTTATLISCAGSSAKKDSINTAEQQAQADISADEAAELQNLPNIELSADLMYKILLSDLAAQQNINDLALSALVDSATETRDPRLAAQATRQAVVSKQYATAIQMARLWQELSPDSVDVHQTLGNLLVVEKKPEEAIDYYSKALALTDEKNRSPLLKQISATLVRYGSPRQALTLIEQLAREYPDSADVALAHASVASSLKDYAVASKAINRTLELDPDNSRAAVFKFSLLLVQKKNDVAEKFALSFLKSQPDAIELRTTLARYYLEANKLKDAERQYLTIHKQDSTSVIAPMALALIRMDSKHYDEATEYLEKVLELQDESDLARIYLGDIASLQDRLDDAIQWYRSVAGKEQLFSSRLRLVDAIMKRDGIDAAMRELDIVSMYMYV